MAGIVNHFQREIRRTGLEQKNLSKEEKVAFEKIKKKKDVIVVPADKGNATVVMNAKDYKTKALDLIGKRPFEEMSRCPKQKVEDRINGFLWDLFQQKVIKKPAVVQPAACVCVSITTFPWASEDSQGWCASTTGYFSFWLGTLCSQQVLGKCTEAFSGKNAIHSGQQQGFRELHHRREHFVG